LRRDAYSCEELPVRNTFAAAAIERST